MAYYQPLPPRADNRPRSGMRARPRIARQCETCGGEFLIPEGSAMLRQGRARFCSKSCAGVHNGSRARPPVVVPIMERVERHSMPEPNTGCWIWFGADDGHGYGQIRVGGRTLRAMRVVFEILRGPIPGGLQLDHLCRTPACINPDHLEPVSMAENLARGVAARGGLPTHCRHGHEYTDANTHIKTDGSRSCRTCNRLRVAAFKARKGS